MIYLKGTVVHYVNISSSSINKPYLRDVENAISNFKYHFLFPLNIRQNWKKRPSFSRSEIGIFDVFFKDCTKKFLKIYK